MCSLALILSQLGKKNCWAKNARTGLQQEPVAADVAAFLKRDYPVENASAAPFVWAVQRDTGNCAEICTNEFYRLDRQCNAQRFNAIGGVGRPADAQKLLRALARSQVTQCDGQSSTPGAAMDKCTRYEEVHLPRACCAGDETACNFRNGHGQPQCASPGCAGAVLQGALGPEGAKGPGVCDGLFANGPAHGGRAAAPAAPPPPPRADGPPPPAQSARGSSSSTATARRRCYRPRWPRAAMGASAVPAGTRT
jgi:hypothetical protein